MRTRTSSSSFAASACALLLALTLTACGDDEESLPVAKDLEAVSTFVNKHAGCQDTDYYSSADMSQIRSELGTAVDGGGECDVDESTDITFLHVTNMGQFQKDVVASGETDDTGFMVGMNFFLDVDRDELAQTFLDAGLLYLACEPNLEIPPTYTRIEADAGCVLTNYAWQSASADY